MRIIEVPPLWLGGNELHKPTHCLPTKLLIKHPQQVGDDQIFCVRLPGSQLVKFSKGIRLQQRLGRVLLSFSHLKRTSNK